MRRSLVVALCASALSCASGGARPAGPKTPPPENAAAYFPLAVGWKWAYQVEQRGDTVLATYAVLEKLVDTVIVQAGENRIAYALLADGIARREALKMGDFVLKSPVRKGATWPIQDGAATVVTVGETVNGPGGSFHNVAVVEENRKEPERILRTWYAAGVGAIAIEYQVYDAAVGRFDVVLRATLRGFTRPGEDPLGAPEQTAGPPPGK